MPRILKKGALPEDRFYICTCSHCKTVSEFRGKEGATRPHGVLEFHCPLCNEQMFTKEPGNEESSYAPKQLLNENT